ncbi:MAG: c-type cytochrome [Pseudomonadota bacterium]
MAVPRAATRNAIVSVMVCIATVAVSDRADAQTVGPQVLEEDVAAHPCRRAGTETAVPFELAAGRTLARSIPNALSGAPGNPLRGRTLMVAADRGNCIACHAVADIRRKARRADSTSVSRFGIQGTVGPALDGVGRKYEAGELRLWVVDPRLAVTGRQPLKPAYHSIRERVRVLEGCENRVLLTAQEIEDIVAYMATLTEAAE